MNIVLFLRSGILAQNQNVKNYLVLNFVVVDIIFSVSVISRNHFFIFFTKFITCIRNFIRMKARWIISLVVSIVLGLIIAKIDTGPHWDDAGISMIMIFSAALLCGYLSPSKPWIVALTCGIWIPLFNILRSSNYGSFLALVPAFIGAFLGSFLKSTLSRLN